MKEILDLFQEQDTTAPPFLSTDSEGSFVIVGSSDNAHGFAFDYPDIGKFKLTALNHTATLLSLMNFLILVDELTEKEFDIYEDDEVVEFLEHEFSRVLSAFFMQKIGFDDELAKLFIMNNRQLVNEAIYNLTEDKKEQQPKTQKEVDESLEGEQFQDAYKSIAYDVAMQLSIRPFEVMSEWSTSEVIVLFAKIANERSLENYVSWKYSQEKAPKQGRPKKQRFYFKELIDDESEEEEND